MNKYNSIVANEGLLYLFIELNYLGFEALTTKHNDVGCRISRSHKKANQSLYKQDIRFSKQNKIGQNIAKLNYGISGSHNKRE
jgi:hypothetical protein